MILSVIRKQIRITEIEAILQNELYESKEHETALINERRELLFQIELAKEL